MGFWGKVKEGEILNGTRFLFFFLGGGSNLMQIYGDFEGIFLIVQIVWVS